jgi:predicted enzyme related to lactoylglutathione lyase
MSTNPIVFWELASSNAESSVEFFNKVFDWQLELDKSVGFYTLPIPKEENEFGGGGVFTLKKAKLPFLTLYIRVDDIDLKAKLIEENGGHIVEPPHEILGGSKICLFNEPAGTTFAMIQRKNR